MYVLELCAESQYVDKVVSLQERICSRVAVGHINIGERELESTASSALRQQPSKLYKPVTNLGGNNNVCLHIMNSHIATIKHHIHYPPPFEVIHCVKDGQIMYAAT